MGCCASADDTQQGTAEVESGRSASKYRQRSATSHTRQHTHREHLARSTSDSSSRNGLPQLGGSSVGFSSPNTSKGTTPGSSPGASGIAAGSPAPLLSAAFAKRHSVFDAAEVESQSVDPSAQGDWSAASDSDMDELPGSVHSAHVRRRSTSHPLHYRGRRAGSNASSPQADTYHSPGAGGGVPVGNADLRLNSASPSASPRGA
eukprot:CAMPEP_0174865406 /NCGR_PEP_ID=MMETSP1114-20130205/60283_1 /TAXON_ID=312471 /ORGANISM="Neobodo designis, Strain CCAP 1951/1" /LENGTH=203 /DNA_ID=CAMNT_0016100533 /DNA_START=55 /DNA_END=666 /DNA_ORIENTATION=+